MGKLPNTEFEVPEPGHARWLGDLLDQQGAALALYAAQWLGAGSSHADDCVQESLVALAAQSPRPANPRAWLFVKVKHLAMTAARSARRRTHHEQNAWRERLRGHGTQENLLQQRELMDALEQIEAGQREVIVLKIWGNLTFDEMAEVLGDSSSGVHRKYQAALAELRKLWCVPETASLRAR